MGGVLVVCTANQIRSPMAERFLVHGLTERFGAVADSVLVMSAGMRVHRPMPIHPMAQAELSRLGIPTEGHKSTALDPGVVEHAHLVLTATRRQRDEILILVPKALPYTFTMRELAWLLDGVSPADVPGRHLAVRVANLAEVARSRRGLRHPLPPAKLDIADPLGGSASGYRRAAAEIAAAVRSVLAVL